MNRSREWLHLRRQRLSNNDCISFDCLFLLFALIIKTSFINFSSCYPDADVCDFQAASAGDADGVQKGMGNWTGNQKDASHNIRMMLPMTARWQ